MNQPDKKIGVVVLISGSGSNLQAIIDQQEQGELPVNILAVISNKASAGGLARARKHNIPAITLEHTNFNSREAFDEALIQHINQFDPALVVLAGFMRILTPHFTDRYEGQLINIHPSLLPKYQGLNTHLRAIESGDKEHGVTVHFVTAELDGGPPIIQAKVPILPGDTPDTLATRVLEKEHIIYPLAIKWFATGRITMKERISFLDEKALAPTGFLYCSKETSG